MPARDRHVLSMPEIIVAETSWRERLDALVGRRRDTLLAGALFACVVVGALVLWARGRPAEVAPPATSPAAATVAATYPAPGAGVLPGSIPSADVVPEALASPATDVLYVHVDGAVRKPGLYEVPVGARVADAIEAAGGPTLKADLGAVNLAELLTDGQKLDVPRVGEEAAPVAVASPGAPSATPGGAVVDVNSADQAMLETIPDVGPVTAAAIIAYRDEVGGFTSIEELLEVDGIGPATLESIRPHVTL